MTAKEYVFDGPSEVRINRRARDYLAAIDRALIMGESTEGYNPVCVYHMRRWLICLELGNVAMANEAKRLARGTARYVIKKGMA